MTISEELGPLLGFAGGLLAFLGSIISYFDRKFSRARTSQEKRKIVENHVWVVEFVLWWASAYCMALAEAYWFALGFGWAAFLIHGYFYLARREIWHRPATLNLAFAVIAVLVCTNVAFAGSAVQVLEGIVANQGGLVDIQDVVSRRQQVIIENQDRIVDALENNEILESKQLRSANEELMDQSTE